VQPTAFGAQDQCYFEAFLCGAPRRRLTLGRWAAPSNAVPDTADKNPATNI